jgi:AcrR family transcriptional regulator
MNLREKILRAAGRLFCECGVRGTTTRRIADEAGVNEVTLFRQFGTKEELLREAIGRNWAAVDLPKLPEVPVAPVGELTAWAVEFADRLRVAAPLIRTSLGEFEQHPGILPRGGSPTARAAAALAGYFDQLRRRGFTAARFDSRAAAAGVVGAILSDAITREGQPDMYTDAPEADIREYMTIVMRGIGVTA